MTRKALCPLAIAGLTALSPACSPTADTASADRLVTGFHQMLDLGRFSEIYAQTSPQMKAVSTEPQFVALLAAVHRKLGAVTRSDRQGWNDQVTTGGHFLTETYRTTFQRGIATETFTFGYNGKTPELTGYNINSQALLLN